MIAFDWQTSPKLGFQRLESRFYRSDRKGGAERGEAYVDFVDDRRSPGKSTSKLTMEFEPATGSEGAIMFPKDMLSF